MTDPEATPERDARARRELRPRHVHHVTVGPLERGRQPATMETLIAVDPQRDQHDRRPGPDMVADDDGAPCALPGLGGTRQSEMAERRHDDARVTTR